MILRRCCLRRIHSFRALRSDGGSIRPARNLEQFGEERRQLYKQDGKETVKTVARFKWSKDAGEKTLQITREKTPTHKQGAIVEGTSQEIDIVKAARLRRFNSGTFEIDTGFCYSSMFRSLMSPLSSDSSALSDSTISALDRTEWDWPDRQTIKFHRRVVAEDITPSSIMELHGDFAGKGLKMALDTAREVVKKLAMAGEVEMVATVLAVEKFSDVEFVGLVQNMKAMLDTAFGDVDEPEESMAGYMFVDKLWEHFETSGRTHEATLLMTNLFEKSTKLADFIPEYVNLDTFRLAELKMSSMGPQDRIMCRTIKEATEDELKAIVAFMKKPQSTRSRIVSIAVSRALFARLLEDGQADLAEDLALIPKMNPPGSQVVASIAVHYMQQGLMNDAYFFLVRVAAMDVAELMTGAEVRAGIRASMTSKGLIKFWELATRSHSAPSLRTRSLFIRRAVTIELGLRSITTSPNSGASRLLGVVCSIILSASAPEQAKLVGEIASVFECWIWRWCSYTQSRAHVEDFSDLATEIPFLADFFAALPFEIADEALAWAIGRSTSNWNRDHYDTEESWPMGIFWPLVGSLSRIDLVWNNPESKSLLMIEFIVSQKWIQEHYLRFRTDEWIAGFIARELWLDFCAHKRHYCEEVPEVEGFIKTGVIADRGLTLFSSDEHFLDQNEWDDLTNKYLRLTPEQIRQRTREIDVFDRAVRSYPDRAQPLPCTHYLCRLVNTLLRLNRLDTATALVRRLDRQGLAIPHSLLTTMIQATAPYRLHLALSLLTLCRSRASTGILAPILSNQIFTSTNPEAALRLYSILLKSLPTKSKQVLKLRPEPEMFYCMMEGLVRCEVLEERERWEAVLTVVKGARRCGYRPGSEAENVEWFIRRSREVEEEREREREMKESRRMRFMEVGEERLNVSTGGEGVGL